MFIIGFSGEYELEFRIGLPLQGARSSKVRPHMQQNLANDTWLRDRGIGIRGLRVAVNDPEGQGV